MGIASAGRPYVPFAKLLGIRLTTHDLRMASSEIFSHRYKTERLYFSHTFIRISIALQQGRSPVLQYQAIYRYTSYYYLLLIPFRNCKHNCNREYRVPCRYQYLLVPCTRYSQLGSDGPMIGPIEEPELG